MMEYGAWGWTRAAMIGDCNTTTANPACMPTVVAIGSRARGLAGLDASIEARLGRRLGDVSPDPAPARDS
jgi:hypothetical protein